MKLCLESGDFCFPVCVLFFFFPFSCFSNGYMSTRVKVMQETHTHAVVLAVNTNSVYHAIKIIRLTVSRNGEARGKPT